MEMATGRVAAIILAAGAGRRMSAALNKVFLPIGGKPILTHTLDLFERSAQVDRVVLVIAEADRDECHELVELGGFHKVDRIVTGGDSRHASEYRGLLALERDIEAGDVELVLIHDAVRPFVTAAHIEAVIAAARRSGAAILAVPAGDRIVIAGDDGSLEDGGDDLWIAQTPQAFRAAPVLEAHRRAAADGFVGTDTASVVEQAGGRVTIVPGRPDNIKITTSDDLLRAELIADGWASDAGLSAHA